MMFNTVMQAAAPAATSPADTGSAAPAPGADLLQADALAADAQAAALALISPFAAWLGEQAQAAAPADLAAPAVQGTDDGAQAASAPQATADDASDDAAPAAALPQDGALLAAMAMPLMPLNAAQVAQAVQAAQPAASAQAGGTPDGAGRQDAATAADVAVGRAAGADAGRHPASAERDPTLAQSAAAPAANDLLLRAATPDQRPDAAPAMRAALSGQGDAGSAAAKDGGAERGKAAGAGPATPAERAAFAVSAPAQPASNAPAADSVKLAGPPTAWRQSLQEALGERMNVQVGKGIEQAVIRLEPPQLGRIDIAIRHSAGTLEVNISATNGEVLRQLQTVSDNLRSDLSQRQFTEVAVTVAPAPKNGAAPFGDPQQGRGRQQEREQDDKQPGHALADAGNKASPFSLGGRE